MQSGVFGITYTLAPWYLGTSLHDCYIKRTLDCRNSIGWVIEPESAIKNPKSEIKINNPPGCYRV